MGGLHLPRPHAPRPRLHRTYSRPDGMYIAMEFIPGDSLEQTWPELSTDARCEVVELVHEELQKLHACSPPKGLDLVVASIG